MATPASQTVHDPEQLQQLIGRPLVPFFFGDGAINEGLELDETYVMRAQENAGRQTSLSATGSTRMCLCK